MKPDDYCLCDWSSERATMAMGRVMDPEGEHRIKSDGRFVHLYRMGDPLFAVPMGAWIVREGDKLSWQEEEPK